MSLFDHFFMIGFGAKQNNANFQSPKRREEKRREEKRREERKTQQQTTTNYKQYKLSLSLYIYRVTHTKYDEVIVGIGGVPQRCYWQGWEVALEVV